MEKYIVIKSIRRVTNDGEVQELQFESGVNVITGPKNAGKTTWLKQLDYLLGKNAPITDVFTDSELASKYVELNGSFIISGTEVFLKRFLKEPGLTNRIFINDTSVSISEFSTEILKFIGIPEGIKFPKGNPYNSQWVELGFRSMLRHLYRKETLWGDLADKQPPNEQYAAQFHLLGIAIQIYSKEYNSNVTEEKRLLLLEAQREQYSTILNRIMLEMSPREEEIYNGANQAEVNLRIAALEEEIKQTEAERTNIVNKHLSDSQEKKEAILVKENELIESKMSVINDIELNAAKTVKLKKKLQQYTALSSTINEELGKLKRTKKSGIIADLKITHCPACDQELLRQKKEKTDHICFLCTQTIREESKQPTIDRLDFEMDQLSSEQKELSELIELTQKDLAESDNTDRFFREKLYYIDLELAPLKNVLFALSYQDVSEIDVRRGRLQEQVQNYKRLLSNISYKNNLTAEIDELSQKIDSEKIKLEKKNSIINFSRIAIDLETGMQYYVNYIKRTQTDRNLWVADGKISVAINENKVAFYVNNKPWTALGAQDQELFLLAYHFGLLTLTGRNGYNVPGIIIIDLPPDLGEVQAASYNYIVEPFVKYCETFKTKRKLQVIFTGRSFENLRNAKIISLTAEWK
ncbi:MAG: hypothetical protein WAT19_01850 [Ferruginibacter sp.]